jgi:STE24 endopeptidase
VNAWSAVGAILLGLRVAGELWLEALNRRHFRRLAAGEKAPSANSTRVVPGSRALDYALARCRFRQATVVYETVLLVGLLWSGVLPRAWSVWQQIFGTGPLADSLFPWCVFALVSVTWWPWLWYERFHLEERFGFNTTRPATWWSDRFKGLVLAAGLGIPVIAAIIHLIRQAGPWWWVWGWTGAVAFALILGRLAPTWILPWFHRFDPLPEGALRERLQRLAARMDFPLRDIQVMDGSRRTRHSNAFFTGWGRARRIVLYDTLLNQLGPEELEAVVAHEMGHARLGHLRQLWTLTAIGWGLGFAAAGWIVQQPDFYRAFGFSEPHPAVAVLLLGLWAGPAGWWLLPWIHAWARRCEFQADAFAVRALGSVEPLQRALERLHRDNLADVPSHPWYHFWHESHPTLPERITALTANARAGAGR